MATQPPAKPEADGHSLRRRRHARRSTIAARRGMVSLEVVMTTAIMLPLAGLLFLLGLDMLKTMYQAVGALVAWPFL